MSPGRGLRRADRSRTTPTSQAESRSAQSAGAAPCVVSRSLPRTRRSACRSSGIGAAVSSRNSGPTSKSKSRSRSGRGPPLDNVTLRTRSAPFRSCSRISPKYCMASATTLRHTLRRARRGVDLQAAARYAPPRRDGSAGSLARGHWPCAGRSAAPIPRDLRFQPARVPKEGRTGTGPRPTSSA